MNKIKLFCLPYAGGSAVIFYKWKQFLHKGIELIPIELAGRGKRFQEPLYKDMHETIDDVYQIVTKSINGLPYAIFGHSMGCIIAYQLSQNLRNNGYSVPIHMFFSGQSAPHVKRADDKKYHLLEEEEFKKAMISLGGTPPEFFDHPELLETFLPLLKNDLKLAEIDLHNREINALNCNISVFFGKEDNLTTEQRDSWKYHTKKSCTIHYFEGGHFFINNEAEQIVKLINKTLFGDIYK